MSRWLKPVLWSALIAACFVLFLAAGGGLSSSFFERYYPILLGVNTVAAVVFFVAALTFLVILILRWRKKIFGSRMTLRMALAISGIALLPCLLIYLISSQFIGRSIDSWFDVRVEHALNSGVTLSGEILVREQKVLLTSARRIAANLSRLPPKQVPDNLQSLAEAMDVESIVTYDIDGKALDKAPADFTIPQSDIPSHQQLANAVLYTGIYQLEGDTQDSHGPLRIRALVPIPSPSQQPSVFLQLTQKVDPQLATSASDLVNGYRDYQELVLARGGLRDMYRITLTLTMLVAVFSALGLALVYALSMTAPLLQLSRGTKKVAEGDLRPIKEFPGNDEINALTQSFNWMIGQIAEAQASVENQRVKAEEARAYLERILENLSSGVMVVDDALHIRTVNNGARSILKNDQLVSGCSLLETEPDLAQELRDQIQLSDNKDIRAEIELARSQSQSPLTIFLRGSRLRLLSGTGWVIVFDDISAVIDAQKAVAWGEVARRLAHEIKNPLTPIRLSAERLEMKLTGKITDPKDAAVFQRSIKMIINQVDAMKQMVNDFRDYAKLPAAVLSPLDLNALLSELASLYCTGGTKIETNLSLEIPKIQADETQLRQLVHNLVGNAIDATAELVQPLIRLSTSPIYANDNSGITAVRVAIEDNGPGFQPKILSKAFEPYVTSKPTGTGLGLPMVKKIVEEHHAKVTVGNRTDEKGNVLGAQIIIIFPVFGHHAEWHALPTSAPSGSEKA